MEGDDTTDVRGAAVVVENKDVKKDILFFDLNERK
jgi:hypothetical protein